MYENLKTLHVFDFNKVIQSLMYNKYGPTGNLNIIDKCNV